MSKNEIIVNRVAQSGIITLNLEAFYPTSENLFFDIREYLYMNLVLKEKDFRLAMKAHDWNIYQGKNLAISCTTDAIVPVWAYMLIVSYAEPFVENVIFGSEQELTNFLFYNALSKIDVEEYRDKRVVIKGCGDKAIPEFAYVEITRLLKPVVKSLMYGEPCSTVPIYKQPRKK